VPPYGSIALRVRVSAYHAPILLLLIFPVSAVAAHDSLLLSTGAPEPQGATQALPDRNASGSHPIAISRAYLASTSFDHSAVLPSTCDVCHNNAVTGGKPINHITTDAACDACHTTRAWLPATFEHNVVSPGSCSACHNGVTAIGKSTAHIATSIVCDNCHRTSAWKPATFNHSEVAVGTCTDCHNGTDASARPTRHIPTMASCDACHQTRAWLPATFDHSTVARIACASCHDGVVASGQPIDHFSTTRTCDRCHNTVNWTSASSFRHSSQLFPGEHFDVACSNCHTTNTAAVDWKVGIYKPDCAACHADDYEPQYHIKTINPATIFYTVNELTDCAGSCHEYVDNSFVSIRQIRAGRHRPRSQW
jgi:hypothetical protein